MRENLDRYMLRNPNVSQVHHMFGRFDFLIEVVVSGREDLARLLKEMQGYEGVNKTETFIVYETLKYDPEGPVKQLLNE